MNEFDHRITVLVKQQREMLENLGLNGYLDPDLCDVGAVFYQLRYQGNWELVIMWVDHKPVDVEIDDDNTRIFLCI